MLRWSVRVTVGERVPNSLSSLFLSPPCLLRYLCDKVVPGNRVTIMGIYSIKKFGLTSNRGRDRVGVGIRSAYVRVLGIQVDTDGSGEFGLWGSGCAVSWAVSLQGYGQASWSPRPPVPERLYDLPVQLLTPPYTPPFPHSLDLEHRPTPGRETWALSPQAYAIWALRPCPTGAPDWLAGVCLTQHSCTLLPWPTQAAASPGL